MVIVVVIDTPGMTSLITSIVIVVNRNGIIRIFAASVILTAYVVVDDAVVNVTVIFGTVDIAIDIITDVIIVPAIVLTFITLL